MVALQQQIERDIRCDTCGQKSNEETCEDCLAAAVREKEDVEFWKEYCRNEDVKSQYHHLRK